MQHVRKTHTTSSHSDLSRAGLSVIFNTDDDESEVISAFHPVPPFHNLSGPLYVNSLLVFCPYPPPPVVFLQINLSTGVFFSPYSTLMNSLDPSGSRLQSLPTGLPWAQSLEVSDMSVAEPPARLRSNPSWPDWCAEAPGASHCRAGNHEAAGL